MTLDDRAPVVYDEDGTPMKVRLVGHECEGDVSGEGHFAYRQSGTPDEPAVVWFQEVEPDA